MTLQEILFIVSIVFFVLAGICIITAVVVFFVKNVPDVQADLSGKKRAAAVAEISAQRPGRDRRKGVARVEPTSGMLDSGQLRSGQLHEPSPLDNPLNQVPHVASVVQEPSGAAQAASAQAAQPVVQQPQQTFQPQPSYQVAPAATSSDASETTILKDDDSSTTILGDDAGATIIPEDDASATTILKDDDAQTEILTDAPAQTSGEEDLAISTQASGSETPATSAPAEQSEARSGSAQTAGAPAPAVLAGFKVVRRIILRESENVVTAK